MGCSHQTAMGYLMPANCCSNFSGCIIRSVERIAPTAFGKSESLRVFPLRSMSLPLFSFMPSRISL